MSNYTSSTASNKQQNIEKYTGTFSKQDGGCTIVINETINSLNNLSALGLYSYLICRPSTWSLIPKHLAGHFKCNIDTIYKYIDYLIKVGLLIRTEKREQGRYCQYHYEVLTSATNEQYVQNAPKRKKPDTEKPDTEKRDTYKTKKVLNKEDRLYRVNAREGLNSVDNSPANTDPKNVELPTPQKAEKKKEKEMINPDYEYPDTLYQQKEMQTATQRTEIGVSEAFDVFWDIYPRKINKARVRAQWQHDGCDAIAEQIITKLQEQIAKDKAFLDGYVCNPFKYIVEKRFEDEVYEGKKQNEKFDHDDDSWASDIHKSILE